MLLEGKKGLVLNVVNDRSIGWAIADLANRHGATVGIGVQNDRFFSKVEKLVEGRERFDLLTIDFTIEEDYARLRQEAEEKYGKLDFLVHAAAFAPKDSMFGRFKDITFADFATAMQISAHSLIRLCGELEPIMNDDSSIVALSYLGSTRATPGYNMMGICKAALEAEVRYLALDLGERGIRVNTVSPGPIRTLAAMGVPGLQEKIRHVFERAPLQREYGQEEAAKSAVYFLSDLSQGVTGQILFVDSGYNIAAT
ncbi:MAG TPA: enoyl-ACP reductase [Fimbriimonas sp.]